MNRMIIKSARDQVREARRKAEEEGEEWNVVGKVSKQKEFDPDALQELRNKKRDNGDDLRTARRKLARTARSERRASGRMKIEWAYEAGELVKIKESAFRRNSFRMERLGLYAGAIGVIVDQEDDTWRQAAGKVLQVMGPMGLQAWDASWVEVAEDE